MLSLVCFVHICTHGNRGYEANNEQPRNAMSKNLTGPARALSPLQSPLNAVCLTVRHLDAAWMLVLMPAVTVPPVAPSNRTASPATLVTGSGKARFLPLAVALALAALLEKAVEPSHPGVRDAPRKVRKARDPRAVNPPLRLPPNSTTRGDRGCARTLPLARSSRSSSPARLLRPRRLLRLPHRLRRPQPRLQLLPPLDPG